ncbi:MAG: arylsulfotransferase family protein [Acidipropionibacterium sp.]|nr:arylsulfotransferase family protein [Acidipropionibacterium sp.]
MLSARSANIVAIVSRDTGDIVWRLGPDFARNPRTEKLGWIVAPGDVHLIPRGTPGEGHLLLLDGGGTGGYGAPRGSVTNGIGVERRDYSRILEIDPISLAVVWQYTPDEAGHVQPLDSYKFFSASGGSVQRLPNGNTLIADSDTGRVFQVTPGHETVWEYVSPTAQKNPVSRATLVPYERLPQLPRPTRTAVIPPNVTDFRVPGSPNGAGAGKITVVDGVDPHRLRAVRDPHGVINSADETPHDFCVVPIAPAGVPEPAAQANSK